MQRRISSTATSVGVNGDFFSLADGRPSGMLAPRRRARHAAEPGPLERGRDARRHARRPQGGLPRHVARKRRAQDADLDQQAARQEPDLALHLRLGPHHARASRDRSRSSSRQFPPAAPNVDIEAAVTSTARTLASGSRPGAQSSSREGPPPTRLQAEALVGETVTLRLILTPDWAVGLRRDRRRSAARADGKPVFRANEAFTTSQLAPRGPRTGVGQRADGSVLLVATDGRQPGYSVGMTNFELAQTLARLGAVTRDGARRRRLLDAGVRGHRPQPAVGRPGAVGRELAHAPVLRRRLARRRPRRSSPRTATASPSSRSCVQGRPPVGRHRDPDWAWRLGRVHGDRCRARRGPTTSRSRRSPRRRRTSIRRSRFRRPWRRGPPAEGSWTLTVSATDDQGLASTATRRFAVNSTLGFLRAPARLTVRPAGSPPGRSAGSSRAPRA